MVIIALFVELIMSWVEESILYASFHLLYSSSPGDRFYYLFDEAEVFAGLSDSPACY